MLPTVLHTRTTNPDKEQKRPPMAQLQYTHLNTTKKREIKHLNISTPETTLSLPLKTITV